MKLSYSRIHYEVRRKVESMVESSFPASFSKNLNCFFSISRKCEQEWSEQKLSGKLRSDCSVGETLSGVKFVSARPDTV